MPEWIEIGQIVAAQGLKGEVRVLPSTDFPERFLEPGWRWLQKPGQLEPQPVELVQGRCIPGKTMFVVQLAGIEDRNQAEALQGSQLFVTESDRPHLEEDEFYVIDLIDLEVWNQVTGEVIGKVINVIPAGNNLLEVELAHQIEPEVLEIPQFNPSDLESNLETKVAQTSSRKKAKIKRKPDRKQTVLIPFVKEIVPVVDFEQHRIEVNPPKGLID
ncbi:MAG: ribosome maturation factor RimM [Microcoleaceae cyanobacterium]